MTRPIQNITDLTLQQLTLRMAEIKEPAWRAKQIHQWLFSHRVHTFEEMTTLSKALRERLAETFTLTPPEVAQHNEAQEGACPGPTEKLLLRLPDGAMTETVLIPATNRITACLSTPDRMRAAVQILCHRHTRSRAQPHPRRDGRSGKCPQRHARRVRTGAEGHKHSIHGDGRTPSQHSECTGRCRNPQHKRL